LLLIRQSIFVALLIAGQIVSAAPSVRAEEVNGGNIGNTATVPRPVPGRWKDSICDWPQNLFPSCYCVCCCWYGCWLLGQSKNTLNLLRCTSSSITVYLYNDLVSQRTGFTTFSFVVGMSMVIWLIAFIMNFFIPAALTWFPIICFWLFALVLRMHFVRQQNINDNQMGLFGEFCCGLWCGPCSVSQSKLATDLCIGTYAYIVLYS